MERSARACNLGINRNSSASFALSATLVASSVITCAAAGSALAALGLAIRFVDGLTTRDHTRPHALHAAASFRLSLLVIP